MSNLIEGPADRPDERKAEAADVVAEQNGTGAPAPMPTDEALTAAVDALAHPMLAVLADGLLLHANLAARALLALGVPLEIGPDRRVAPRLAGHRGNFASAVQTASNGQPQQLTWADGEQTVHATLRPLAEPTPGTPSPPVLVMLAPPPSTVFDVSGFANTHGLSAAETRVLEALLHGHQAEITAQRLGVGVATVRSQIASIRRKTGHDSVATLLAALGDLPPLRHPGK
jgi:DNA-binding CsgD family transcriptional regulator